MEPGVERVESFPPGVKVARWVIRDDNNQHHHGVVSLSKTPLYIELRWKPSRDGAETAGGTLSPTSARTPSR